MAQRAVAAISAGTLAEDHYLEVRDAVQRLLAEIAVAGYIDWFNHRRLHGESGLVPPVEHSVAVEWRQSAVLTPRGNPWERESVVTVLANPRNAGLRAHKGELVNDADGRPKPANGTRSSAWSSGRR